MTSKRLKTWMDRNKLTEVDVASALSIHPITVIRFLGDDSKARKSTLSMFERIIQPGEFDRMMKIKAATLPRA